MSRQPSPAYGSRRLAVWRQNWRDRRAGLAARANARMGFLRPPVGESGKVIWIKGGGSRDSVRLAVELLGAVRQKRLDVRLALTFEEDFADIVEPRVSGLRKIGLGYGPCDLPGVVRRTLDRLQPLAIVLVDTEPHPNLLREAARRGMRLVAYNTPPSALQVEAAYPVDEAQAAAWAEAGTAAHVAPPADPLSLFVEAQVDTTLKSLVARGEEGRELWWWHGAAAQGPEFVAAWRASALGANGVLFVSACDTPAPDGVDLSISRWGREPLPAGAVVGIDDARWRPAVASAVSGAYLADADRFALWEALAAGAPMVGGAALLARFPQLASVIETGAAPAQVLQAWAAFAAEPIAARKRGDACRRIAWDERRRLQSVLNEFLQRVFDW